MIDKDILDDQIHDVTMVCNLLTWSKHFRGGLILDVGASLGFFSKKIVEYYPNSRVVAIEPSIINFGYLIENVKGLNVLPIQGAVTNGENVIKFYENINPNQGTLFLGEYFSQMSDSIVDEYPVLGLDFQSLVKTLEPNLIKIDIEGYEFFLDYSNLPKSVNTIVMEVHMADISAQGQILKGVIENDVEIYSNIVDNLKSQGFEFVEMVGQVFPWNGLWTGESRTHLMCMSRE